MNSVLGVNNSDNFDRTSLHIYNVQEVERKQHRLKYENLDTYISELHKALKIKRKN